MNYQELIEKLTPEMHRSLKRAIETGKWPDGGRLTDEQKTMCMEAVINYDNRFLSEEERVGYIDRGSKAEGELCDDETPSPLKWS